MGQEEEEEGDGSPGGCTALQRSCPPLGPNGSAKNKRSSSITPLYRYSRLALRIRWR